MKVEEEVEEHTHLYYPGWIGLPCFKRDFPREGEIYDNLFEIKQKWAELQNVKFGGTAFVVFRKQECVEKLEDFYEVGYKGWALWIVSLFTRCSLYKYERNQLTEDGKRVKVS